MGGGVWLAACFLPSLSVRLTGTIGGGDEQQLLLFSRRLALVPGMVPWSLAYVAGGCTLLALAVVALGRGRPTRTVVVVFLLSATATLHLAVVGA